jgi:uncharacterized membrane protein YphA (DoxX/SURF4 family)
MVLKGNDMNNALTSATSPSRGWNIGLWVAQVALAAMYAMAGYNKLFLPPEALVQMGMGFVADTPLGLVRFIGTAELLGAAGMILPSVTRIMPQLTPLAAIGLAIIQVLAMPVHIVRGEYMVLPINLVLLGLAVLVVWGRRRKAPISPRA